MHDNIFLPDAFLAQVQETMPSHLSMDEFVAACKRPLRRSIRVNTLKNSVEEFKKEPKKNNGNWTQCLGVIPDFGSQDKKAIL